MTGEWVLVQRAQRVVEDARDLFGVPDVDAAMHAFDRADGLLPVAGRAG